MGLGKTVQSIAFLCHVAENYGVWGPFLIISSATTGNRRCSTSCQISRLFFLRTSAKSSVNSGTKRTSTLKTQVSTSSSRATSWSSATASTSTGLSGSTWCWMKRKQLKARPVSAGSFCSASTVATVYFSVELPFKTPWLNFERSSCQRAHHLGQTKQVTVYRLICKGTIEERTLQRAREKRSSGWWSAVKISSRTHWNRKKLCRCCLTMKKSSRSTDKRRRRKQQRKLQRVENEKISRKKQRSRNWICCWMRRT